MALLVFEKFLGTFFQLDPPVKFIYMKLGPPESPEKGRALLCFQPYPPTPPPSPAFITKERVMRTLLPFLFHGTSILTEDVFLPEEYLLFLLPGALVPQIFMLVPSCHSGL